jgi:hypothetical protein
MITLVQKGEYQLIETKGGVKILSLDRQVFAWVYAQDIGEILVSSHSPHATDHVLAVGRFRLYDVEDEPKFVDNQHLELLVGDGLWQGYLLLTGLPTDAHTRTRIVPTHEVISQTS